MRQMLLAIAGLSAIGFGALSAQPASAQPYEPGYRHPPRDYHGDRGYRPAFYPGPEREGYGDGYRHRRHGYYRPAFVGPPCFVRMERAWNGWRWVQRPVRICR
ncbi:hypothetical protein [Microvirga antarctica]|uniref:hypothetical protein n=1 Tax=Microvirga antarctica TaxID=2819233 RepID=UPI001B3006A1|nr:hypothetical protein [Microvirga antarctica]